MCTWRFFPEEEPIIVIHQSELLRVHAGCLDEAKERGSMVPAVDEPRSDQAEGDQGQLF